MQANIYGVKNVHTLWMNSQAWKISEHSQTHTYASMHREVWPARQGCETLLFEKTPRWANRARQGSRLFHGQNPDQSSSHLSEKTGKGGEGGERGEQVIRWNQTGQDRRHGKQEGARKKARMRKEEDKSCSQLDTTYFTNSLRWSVTYKRPPQSKFSWSTHSCWGTLQNSKLFLQSGGQIPQTGLLQCI